MNPVVRRTILLCLLVVMAVSGGLVLRDRNQRAKEHAANQTLAQIMHEAEETAQEEQDESAQEESPEETPPAVSSGGVLPQFSALCAQNSALAGWLTIPGAEIDYPVVYTPEDQNHYLRLAFDGSYAVSGTLFLGVPWSDETNHAIIYGHHMKNGTMFGCLNRYANETFGRENAVIRFDTLYETREYELVAAFYSKVYPAGDTEHFHYYEYADLSDPEDFAYYVREAKTAALYETGITPEWGDSLLTLSTCEYHTDQGRFAVVFRLKTE